jgi:hypothetical protein
LAFAQERERKLVKIINYFLRLWGLTVRVEREFTAAIPNMEKGSKLFYAEELLGNPLYMEIIGRIERDAIDKWKSTPSEAKEVREQYYLHVQVLKQINQYIKGYISDYKINEAQKRIINMKGDY